MAYKIELAPAAVKQLKKLDGTARQHIASVLDRVATLDNPRAIGAALHGDKLGIYWKYRAGDWRIVASIRDKVLTIEVIEIGHRSEIY